MTILPIVERELRVASRLKSTHRWRFGLSAVAFVVAVVIAARFDAFPQNRTGLYLFNAISFIALCYGLVSGALHTADCLCAEKRLGTLGLLFLTDLRGHDIALGKLASSSLHAYYGLLAVLPVLALSLLMGGVTLGEFGRTSFVLLLTMGWSLAIGLMVSSFLRDARTAGSLTSCLVLAPTFLHYGLSLVAAALTPGGAQAVEWCSFLSPVSLYASAKAAAFQSQEGVRHFLLASGTIAATGILAVAAASWQLGRCWRHVETLGVSRRPWQRFGAWLHLGGARRRRRLRPLLDRDAYAWLIRRDRWTVLLAWIAILGILPFWLFFFLSMAAPQGARGGSANWVMLTLCLCAGYLLHVAVKSFLIMESTRQSCHDAESGALELLMVAPISARDIVKSHRRTLERVFAAPLAILIGTNVLVLAFVAQDDAMRIGDDNRAFIVTLTVGGIVLAWLDSMAIISLGLWMGLKHKRARKATWATRAVVFGIPYGFLAMSILMVFMGAGAGSGTPLGILIFFFLIVVVTDYMAWQHASDGLNGLLRRAASGDATEISFPNVESPPLSRPDYQTEERL